MCSCDMASLIKYIPRRTGKRLFCVIIDAGKTKVLLLIGKPRYSFSWLQLTLFVLISIYFFKNACVQKSNSENKQVFTTYVGTYFFPTHYFTQNIFFLHD